MAAIAKALSRAFTFTQATEIETTMMLLAVALGGLHLSIAGKVRPRHFCRLLDSERALRPLSCSDTR
jgi:hypothetical protein